MVFLLTCMKCKKVRILDILTGFLFYTYGLTDCFIFAWMQLIESDWTNIRQHQKKKMAIMCFHFFFYLTNLVL